ncbi:MAG: DNA-binding response regulator KdpE, partial [uncultured Chloroflexia bacterium]
RQRPEPACVHQSATAQDRAPAGAAALHHHGAGHRLSLLRAGCRI